MLTSTLLKQRSGSSAVGKWRWLKCLCLLSTHLGDFAGTHFGDKEIEVKTMLRNSRAFYQGVQPVGQDLWESGRMLKCLFAHPPRMDPPTHWTRLGDREGAGNAFAFHSSSLKKMTLGKCMDPNWGFQNLKSTHLGEIPHCARNRFRRGESSQPQTCPSPHPFYNL